MNVASDAAATPAAPVAAVISLEEEFVERIPHKKWSVAVSASAEIADIAEKSQNWELMAHLLGLSDREVEEIKRDHQLYEEEILAVRLIAYL